jgi:four helix bundle protein
MKVTRFEDLVIWQDARSLCKLIFDISQKGSFSKDFKLRDQIRTSSGSIMDNTAEGFERDGNREFIQFLSFAKGSCGECRSQSYRAFDFQYINSETLEELISRTIKLSCKISKLITYLQGSKITGTKFRKPEPEP